MIHHRVVHQIFYSLTLCVGDENLSEMVVADEFHKLRDSVVI